MINTLETEKQHRMLWDTEHKYWINEYMMFSYCNKDIYGFLNIKEPEDIAHRMYLLSSILFEEIPDDISENNLDNIVDHLRVIAEQHKDSTPSELAYEYRERLKASL